MDDSVYTAAASTHGNTFMLLWLQRPDSLRESKKYNQQRAVAEGGVQRGGQLVRRNSDKNIKDLPEHLTVP